MKQMAIYACKQLGDGKLCDATCCESISGRPTLADNREVWEHHYAAKQHLVHSIRGTHTGDRERGMINQRPTVDMPGLNRYQVRAQVDNVQFHFIQSVGDNIAEHYNLHRFESATERL